MQRSTWCTVIALALAPLWLTGACDDDGNPGSRDQADAGQGSNGAGTGSTGSDAGASTQADSAVRDAEASDSALDSGRVVLDSGGEGGAAEAGSIACSGHDECPGSTRCEPDLGYCVDCFFDSDCDDASTCRGTSCVPTVRCESASDCPDGEVCDEDRWYCTECTGDDDCPAAHHCRDREICVPFLPCDTSLDCEAGLVCGDQGECVECNVSNDCDVDQQCIDSICRKACDSDNDCTQQGELCTEPGGAGHCAECLDDSQCDPDLHCQGSRCVRDVCSTAEERCGVITCTIVAACDSGFSPGQYCGAMSEFPDSEWELVEGAWFVEMLCGPTRSPEICNESGSGYRRAESICPENTSCTAGGGIAFCEPAGT